MDILKQQLAGHIPDVPSIRTKLSDPFPTWVPVAQWVERLTSNMRAMGSIPVRDSEVFSSEKKKLVSTQTLLTMFASCIKSIYFIDMSVLPKNRQLVLSIRNYIQDKSEIFFISSLLKISLTSFLCFSSSIFFRNTHIYV